MAYGRGGLLSKALLPIPFLALPAMAEPVTLLAFGDSLTQGYGLADRDGFVPTLEAWLQAEGADVIVINGGVSGDTTAGGAARIAWSLTPEVDAVLVALGGNDLLRGVDPADTRENLDAILTEIGARNLPALLVGMEATGNYGDGFKADFDAIYPDLAEKHDVPLFGQFLQGLVELEDRQAALRDYFQADATHPNAKGVEMIVERMGPAVLDLVRGIPDD
ncbi:arylesterase [Maritimibacter sp. HL-12]|uniref:arylesterase n=1 Tax=Maritimibacter sp. HL-12 TaxID=1162418 RepID=UPI000A0F0509|nr:arylesterase [Maritimibacter sp. HL-12]SMH40656.1 acyl-CoA thioesterase-1 [Maritimibacter sp. HL-12]